MQKNEIFANRYNKYLAENNEVGVVTKVSSSIAYIEGLPGAKTWEVVYFESGHMGVVRSLSKNELEVMVFSNESVLVGTNVSRTSFRLSVPVGNEVLGNVVDSLGNPIYNNVHISGLTEYREIDTKPLGIESRSRIT